MAERQIPNIIENKAEGPDEIFRRILLNDVGIIVDACRRLLANSRRLG